MTADDQEILKQRYEVRFGNEVIKTVGNSLSSIYARCLGIATPINVLGYDVNLCDEQELIDDLINQILSLNDKIIYKQRRPSGLTQLIIIC